MKRKSTLRSFYSPGPHSAARYSLGRLRRAGSKAESAPRGGRGLLGPPGPANGQRATCEPGVCWPASSQKSRAHTGGGVSPTEQPGVQSKAKKHWSPSSHPTLTVVKARKQGLVSSHKGSWLRGCPHRVQGEPVSPAVRGPGRLTGFVCLD